MKPLPTLDDIAAQLGAQDAELAVAVSLAGTIDPSITIDPRTLAAFDEHVDALPLECARLLPLGIRA